MDFDILKERDQKSHMPMYGRYPLAVERAQGPWLYAPDGKKYLDLLSGIAVCSLGHCHPEITETITDQAARAVHLSNLFYTKEQILAGEKLLETSGMDRFFFCNSGAEANEGAIKLARRYMRKVKKSSAGKIIALNGSFHGRTLATLTATGQDKIKDGFDPLPQGFAHIPPGDLEALKREMDGDTAALIIEIVQGEGGVLPLDRSFVQAASQLCRERGVLLIVDEIQTGMCRTGKFWAFEHHGIEPDIVTAAKALANGLPAGAVMAKEEVAAGFEPGAHGTTFGGGPLICAVISKTLEIMTRDDMAGQAARKGDFLTGMLGELAAKLPDHIVQVRCLGLMVGIELSFDGSRAWSELLNKGYVLNLTQGNVLRLLPPLNIGQDLLANFVLDLEQVLLAEPLS